jgi:ferrous iron transport protein A
VGAPTLENATLQSDELERRLLEMGFVEGARVEILHEGFIGRDPICVRLDDMRVALRRREARNVMVRRDANS